MPPHAGLARVAWERGDLGAAIRGYRWVVARLPLPEYVIALGDLYTMAGRAQQADDAYALAATEATLFRANGVNVDVELALFEADHGDTGGGARGREGRLGGAPQHQRRRRDRVGLVPVGPLPERPRATNGGRCTSARGTPCTGTTRR